MQGSQLKLIFAWLDSILQKKNTTPAKAKVLTLLWPKMLPKSDVTLGDAVAVINPLQASEEAPDNINQLKSKDPPVKIPSLWTLQPVISPNMQATVTLFGLSLLPSCYF